MNYKSEAIKAIKRINQILYKWEKNKIESREAVELLNLDIKTIISHLERIQDKVNKLKKINIYRYRSDS